MKHRVEIVPVTLADGSVVQVEATSLGGDENIAIGAFSFEEVRHAIRGVAHEIGSVLAEVKPDKASVEFGLEVAIESGKLLALWVKGTGTATLKIVLEWEKEQLQS